MIRKGLGKGTCMEFDELGTCLRCGFDLSRIGGNEKAYFYSGISHSFAGIRQGCQVAA